VPLILPVPSLHDLIDPGRPSRHVATCKVLPSRTGLYTACTRAPCQLCSELTCYDFIGDAQGVTSSTKGQHVSTKGQHVTRSIYCDCQCTCVTGVTLMQLDSHIGDVICDSSHKYVTRVAIRIQSRNCATAPVASSLNNMLNRIAYMSGHLSLIPSFALMYYFTSIQVTSTHLHNETRSALVTHHYYCLGTSSNQPCWI
jgi:hypothetical protein